jgi:hypothetical protein
MALDPYIEAHRTDVGRETYWLVEIRFPVVQRLTDAPDAIVYGGHSFSPAALTVEGVTSDVSGASSGSGGLSIGSGDDYWPTLLAALAEDERHPEVILFEAWFDPAAATWTPAAVRTVTALRLESARWTPLEAKITLGPGVDAGLGRIPLREYGSGTCTVRRFKDGVCGHTGLAATCGNGVAPERTYEACVALGNQARFGGQRQLPPEDLTISWEWNVANLGYKTATLTLRRRDV